MHLEICEVSVRTPERKPEWWTADWLAAAEQLAKLWNFANWPTKPIPIPHTKAEVRLNLYNFKVRNKDEKGARKTETSPTRSMD